MVNTQTMLYMLSETKYSMMSYVIITRRDRAIVIDGGWAEDMPNLKRHINNREIAAWILTHPHKDHISGFVNEIMQNGGRDFDIKKIYYHFPPFEDLHNHTPEDYSYYKSEFEDMLPAFNSILPQIEPLTHIVEQGESIIIDEIKIDFLFTYHDYLTSNVMNDSSLVFKVNAPNKSVLFLGDIGPQGGDVLYWESRDLLKADIVQMAHHGHVCCGMEIYAEINPKICLWNTDEWLYNEKEVPEFLEDFELARKRNRTRMYGTPITRKWMDSLGIKEHYYTKDGTQVLKI